MERTTPSTRVRREPPRFRGVALISKRELSPRLVRVTLGGPELAGLEIERPAASVRLLIPEPGADELVMPAWNGNEFLLPDGSRPTIRTFTPGPVDGERNEVALDVVIHPGGRVSAWLTAAGVGDPAAISGPGRGYAIDDDAAHFLLAGDETALPAILQLVAAIPPGVPVAVLIEVADPAAALEFPTRPELSVCWLEQPSGRAPGTALVAAVATVDLPSGAKVWAAGEAAAMHRIRKVLFDGRGLARSDVTVRGYWKARSLGGEGLSR